MSCVFSRLYSLSMSTLNPTPTTPAPEDIFLKAEAYLTNISPKTLTCLNMVCVHDVASWASCSTMLVLFFIFLSFPSRHLFIFQKKKEVCGASLREGIKPANSFLSMWHPEILKATLKIHQILKRLHTSTSLLHNNATARKFLRAKLMCVFFFLIFCMFNCRNINSSLHIVCHTDERLWSHDITQKQVSR